MDPRDTASRDLLVGLLALQNGLVDQDDLILAFRAWTRDKSRPIAEVLADQGAIDADDRALLEALAAKHLKRHGDDSARSLAALKAGRSTRESLAEIGDPEIEATLARVGQDTTDGDDPDRTATYSVGTATTDGRRFRVLRPHARGGLGAVFVALDGEFNREVALKRILDSHADDPVSRQRFLIEAEITGGLEHPGIVPVYGLGTYGEGRPFYAMRFIRGDSLKDAIATFHREGRLASDPGARSLALRNLLRRFTDVCNAIDYAHGRGILHRDLKPGNVILGRHGETLVVDWGLAKSVGRADPGSASDERTLVPSSASGSAETLPGSALGTPAYMSPEQARGDLDHLGPRSDVYSLGATLYCLLTGRPPFEGDVGAVLRAVEKGDFAAPRSVDATTDPALEAVCLKAMAVEPESRYATPRALADDVERWAADEPVSARPEPLAERIRRWMRRRRTAVTAAAAVLVAATLGLAAVLAVQAKANRDLKRANAQVQARFDLALEAIQTFHTGVAEDVLLKNDNLKPVRDRLLKDAIDFYKRLEGQLSGQTDRGSRRALGRAYTEMAALASKIGAMDQALAGHRQALAVRRGLAAEAGADGEATAEVGRSLNDLAQVLWEIGRTDEAIASLDEALALQMKLARSNPADPQFQRDLAMSHSNFGLVLSETGGIKDAIESYNAALAIRERLAKAEPTAIYLQRDLADSHANIGNLQLTTSKPEEALASHKAALAIRRLLVRSRPNDSQSYSDLAASYTSLGTAYRTTGHSTEALASQKDGMGILEFLVKSNPAVTRFQQELANGHHILGAMQQQVGDADSAMKSYESARTLGSKLADANPSVTDFQKILAGIYHDKGRLLNATGQLAASLEAHRAALAIQRKLSRTSLAKTGLQDDLANSYNSIGLLLNATGEPAKALESYEEARALQQALADANPTVPEFQRMLAVTYSNMAISLNQIGEPAAALEKYRSARAIHQKLVDANPSVPQGQRQLT